MYVLCVTANIKQECVEDFLAASREYAYLTHQEKGNIWYDFLQSEDDPTCFVIYEAYKSKEDFLFHRETTHSREWKENVEAWNAGPRQRLRCNSILFGID